MSRTDSGSAASSAHNIRCQITTQIFFNPVIAVSDDSEQCGHCFEKEAIEQWMQQQQESDSTATCPVCRAEIALLAPALLVRAELEKAFSKNHELYNEVYFDLKHFRETFEETETFNTPIFRLYITLLENAGEHLNTAIDILASTPSGRDLLRKKLKIESASGKYFFGNAEISAESLQIQVNSKSIREWLSMTTAMEVALDEEQEVREAAAFMQTEEQEVRTAIDAAAQTAFLQLQARFSRARLFLLRNERSAATAGQRLISDTVDSILQLVVYGEEHAVKAALEAVNSNPTQLSALLSDTSTVEDYSNRTITGTLLQAAAAAGDIEMCLMLKKYMTPEAFSNQLAKLFPTSIEAHGAMQQHNAFNFGAILAAICAADTADLDAALNKTYNGSTLCYRLEEFRRTFTEISHREKIFNPQHLLRAFETYNTLWDRCNVDKTTDPDSKKRDLFWRQIIGFCQRFVPACYAQAFSQGLHYLVEVDQPDSWRPEALERDLNSRRSRDCFYFPLPVDSHSGLGFDFAVCTVSLKRLQRNYGHVMVTLKKFCQVKTANLKNLVPRQSDERRCVVQ